VKTVTVQEAQADLEQVLADVVEGGRPTFIQRPGHPPAVVISAEAYGDFVFAAKKERERRRKLYGAGG
jgi:prevent-host-death family protein